MRIFIYRQITYRANHQLTIMPSNIPILYLYTKAVLNIEHQGRETMLFKESSWVIVDAPRKCLVPKRKVVYLYDLSALCVIFDMSICTNWLNILNFSWRKKCLESFGTTQIYSIFQNLKCKVCLLLVFCNTDENASWPIKLTSFYFLNFYFNVRLIFVYTLYR